MVLTVSVYGSLDKKRRDSFDKQFAVGSVLGSGGFGTVYSAVRQSDGKLVSSCLLLITKWGIM